MKAGINAMIRKDSHFGDQEWADFVNRQSLQEKTEEMQNHLDSNCQSCAQAAAVWTKVHEAAQREPHYQVPEWAIRYVRNAFAVQVKPQQHAGRTFEIPRLVFDSFFQPAAVGVRSAGAGPRQLRYKADDVGVELRLEPDRRSRRISITGQVSKLEDDRQGLTGIPIVVRGTAGTLAETSTNQFGEFQISCAPEKDLQFSLVMDGKALTIPLNVTEARESYGH
jgi:hypothetical protein